MHEHFARIAMICTCSGSTGFVDLFMKVGLYHDVPGAYFAGFGRKGCKWWVSMKYPYSCRTTTLITLDLPESQVFISFLLLDMWCWEYQ